MYCSNIGKIIRNCALYAKYQNHQAAEPFIENIIRNCIMCWISKSSNGRTIQPYTTPHFSELGVTSLNLRIKSLILIDYYSKYIGVVGLSEITLISVIKAIKSVSACHGIPQILRTDNGPQYSSAAFKGFCKQYGIEHETSSFYFQSSNREAERAIQTVIRFRKKASDRHLALLDYNALLCNCHQSNSWWRGVLEIYSHPVNQCLDQENMQSKLRKRHIDAQR